MNMGYCRFENTLADLRDCLEHMDDDDLSEGESADRLSIINLAVRIALAHGHKVGRKVVEVEGK